MSDPMQELLDRLRETEAMAREARREARAAREEATRERMARQQAEEAARAARGKAPKHAGRAVAALSDVMLRLLTRLGFKGVIESVADSIAEGQMIPVSALLETAEDHMRSAEGAWCLACLSWHHPDLPMCAPSGWVPDWMTQAMRLISAAGGHVMMDRHMAQQGGGCTCDEDGSHYDPDQDDAIVPGCPRCREVNQAILALRIAVECLERIADARRRGDWEFERSPGNEGDEFGGSGGAA